MDDIESMAPCFLMSDTAMFLPVFDACHLAHGRDAPINWRALFERSELVRPPPSGRPFASMRPDGASLVLGPFAETKGPRLRGRNPATQKTPLIKEPEKQVQDNYLLPLFDSQTPGRCSITHLRQ